MWRRVFSQDHKVIGIQYSITALLFLLLGFLLMMIMRWQLAHPGQPNPIIGAWLGDTYAPRGVIAPEFYNALGAMHGTIMVFLGVVPLAVGGFGNFLVPLQIGARDMGFPTLNMLSYWTYLAGGLVMLVSFILPGGPAQSGWTSFPPLSIVNVGGQTAWLAGMILIITSSLLGSINAIVTIVQLRARGLTFMRMPFFVWTQLVTGFLLLLAFPPLESAAILQLMDRLAGTSFFLPSGLVVSGRVLENAGGGNPLLWQHLFWFLAHPEVYVLILPAMGIVAEIVAANTRKPLFGYRGLVYSVLWVGVLSFVVWAHHMYITGMGTTMSAFFQTTTIIISIPSVVILTCLFLSLWGASIRFTTPMLFALAFLPMFGLGGLTGLPLGMAAPGLHLHDTYYVIAHFHYIVAPGTIFALFAGIYHWYPKATGRRMSEGLGRLHFAGSVVCMNLIFAPMFVQGLAGMNRRLYDGGAAYALNHDVLPLHTLISYAAWAMGLFQIPFIVNVFWSLRRGAVAAANPWDATTLEWAAASPPGHGNFATLPAVYRGPYEYSVPGVARDFSPQFEADGVAQGAGPRDGAGRTAQGAGESAEGGIPYSVDARPDTGFYNAKLGTWLFLASEVMLFGGLFSSYVLLRGSVDVWPLGRDHLSLALGTANTIILLASSATMFRASRASAAGRDDQSRRMLLATFGLGGVFLAIKAVEWFGHIAAGDVPARNNFFATYFVLTGLHALHIAGGAIVMAYLALTGPRALAPDARRFVNRVAMTALYWYFVDVVWIVLFVALYLL